MSLNRYFIKKSVARIQQEAMQSALKRSLGKWNLVSMGIGCIIGTGIFVMTGTAAAHMAGPALVFSFVLAGIACAFAGLCYAEMASMLPISGSAYTYSYATSGELIAWIMGWLLLLEYGVAAATVSVGWSGYVVSFLRDFGVFFPPELTVAWGEKIKIEESLFPLFTEQGYLFDAGGYLLTASGAFVTGLFNVPAAVAIVMVTMLLIVGVSESARVNNFIVFVKLSVLLLFICIGVLYIDLDNWHPFIPPQLTDEHGVPIEGKFGFSGIQAAASWIFFAYVGFEAVSTAAAEAKDPQKDMPFGILGSLIVCTVIYMLVSAVLTGVVHYSHLGVPDPLAVAANEIGISWFKYAVKVGAIMGLSSVMLVLLYGQTRIFYIMSRDGLLPQAFCKVHPKFHTPYVNTMLVGAAVAAAAGLVSLDALGNLVNLGTLMAFMLVCFSVFYLHYKSPEIERPFRTPGKPVTPILGILCCGYLIYHLPDDTFKAIGVYLAIGLAVYFLYGQFHSRLAREEKPLPGDPAFVKGPHDPQLD